MHSKNVTIVNEEVRKILMKWGINNATLNGFHEIIVVASNLIITSFYPSFSEEQVPVPSFPFSLVF
jgi:hypothetical protein